MAKITPEIQKLINDITVLSIDRKATVGKIQALHKEIRNLQNHSSELKTEIAEKKRALDVRLFGNDPEPLI